ncbi:MAG: cyclic nucleotide-binding domain-containing protein [Acidobacteria bacterium]|nr:cyclic nucleotide-binding domain-containing protein [Acidobacteriota bacterium]
MTTEALGKIYHDGDVIVRQGEMGDCMFVIQEGVAEVLQRKEDKEYCLALLSEGDCFGEMALFEKEVRSATVRARGEVRVLTVDKKTFLRRVHEDPSLAFSVLQKMSHRIRDLNAALNKALGRRSSLR